jgi:hypothetical protein
VCRGLSVGGSQFSGLVMGGLRRGCPATDEERRAGTAR